MKKDNSTIAKKSRLRANGLRELGTVDPLVLEAYGGIGSIYQRCYRGVAGGGVVFEKDSRKSETLAVQRPNWRVYETDCVAALDRGVASDMSFDVLDLDPYGSPWPALEAIFDGTRERLFADRMLIAVNDGFRQNLKLNRGWAVKLPIVERAVEEFGNANMHKAYLGIAQEMLTWMIKPSGFKVSTWAGYYTGAGDNMTHYAAVVER